MIIYIKYDDKIKVLNAFKKFYLNIFKYKIFNLFFFYKISHKLRQK